ncbi:unnamed protein product [Pleuronectes platessa]|uniref:Uncharacterized protein n=1 Tax=Pleuronectes platessa TaxID=8262 RepID=A0A9N7V8Z8_PLEPL|nr:unnamed protein product [Pleuronectes platessa]
MYLSSILAPSPLADQQSPRWASHIVPMGSLSLQERCNIELRLAASQYLARVHSTGNTDANAGRLWLEGMERGMARRTDWRYRMRRSPRESVSHILHLLLLLLLLFILLFLSSSR